MKINILKCGLISAALAVGLVGLFSGCSETASDPYVVPTMTSSSYEQSSSSVHISSSTLVSPIRPQPLGVTPNSQFDQFIFTGSALLDGYDTLANWDSQNEPFFTGVDINLVRVDPATGAESSTPLSAFLTYEEGTFPRFAVNLLEMNLRLVDPNKTECGMYRLYVSYFASNDTMGTASYNQNKFITNETLDFFRDDIHCVEEQVESSSSEAVTAQIELIKYEGSFTNKSIMGFSFTTGTEVPAAEANIGVSLTETEELILKGLNGFKVTEYTNDVDDFYKDEEIRYDDDWDSKTQPVPAHMSDFRFKQSALDDEYEGFDNLRFYIAIGPNYNPETGDDFYALTLKDKGNVDNNGNLTVTIIYYKNK